MAPQRKHNHDDARSEGSHLREKPLSSTGAGVSKGKKNAGSALRDVTNASSVGTSENIAGANGHTSEPGDAIKFPELPRRVLHAYRNAHHLSVPSSFSSHVNQSVLSDPTSIGILSPTMNRPKEKRRIGKDALARAVRRDFMDQSVNELDVEASACYIVRNGDKAFRMRFVPQKK